jgi:hypothetical protein
MSIEPVIQLTAQQRNKRLFWMLQSGILLAVTTALPVAAQITPKEVDLCTGVSGGSCYTVEIKNVSSATVMSTDFIRNSTDGKCEKDKVKVKKNDTGNNAVPNKEVTPYIEAKLNSKCAYEIKFNVTNGCTGDTRARIKAGKKPIRVALDKNCGTLETIKHY